VSDDGPFEWTGRTSGNKIVNFSQDEDLRRSNSIAPGQLVDVKIEKAYAHSLWGKSVGEGTEADGLKGEKSYAA